MRKYTTLLFDADMTLFDFDAAERDAFGIVMADYGIQLSEGDFERYSRINKELWSQFGRGEITKEYLQDNRFRMFFDTLDTPPSIDGKTVNASFLEALADCSQLFDGAEELCRALSGKYEMYIMTNGISRTQRKRFRASPILGYFRDIFVSEDAGAPKPRREYFDYVFSRIGEDKRKSSVIIGDSLEHDIAGGIAAGIDTVWYNARGERGTADIVPTVTVHSYAELLQLLL